MVFYGEKEVFAKIMGLCYSFNLFCFCFQVLYNVRLFIESVKQNIICVLLERI